MVRWYLLLRTLEVLPTVSYLVPDTYVRGTYLDVHARII